MIEIEGVSKSFDGGRTWAVRGVSVRVEEGSTLVLLGSSGCGKTTTLKMINRLIEPSEGEIRVDGIDVRTRDVLGLRRSIGYVFQDIGLMPHMSVMENAALVPRLLGWSKTKRRARAAELLEMVGLDPGEFGDRRPRRLSGGQRQRVGIARALAAGPKYLLMDEPFGALDAVTRAQLQDELIGLRERLGTTVVFVTHDLFEAARLGDRIAVMNEGGLEQEGTLEELTGSAATAFVERLFGEAEKQAAALGGGTA